MSKMNMWVPFRDATSGKETYGAGRYLDLDQRDIASLRGNGCWISMKRIIRDAPTAKPTPAPLFLQKNG